jgi:hypothetical protein
VLVERRHAQVAVDRPDAAQSQRGQVVLERLRRVR